VACGWCHVNQDHRIDEKSSVGDALAKASGCPGPRPTWAPRGVVGRQVGPAPVSSRDEYPHGHQPATRSARRLSLKGLRVGVSAGPLCGALMADTA
jgi:hypothetical protein